MMKVTPVQRLAWVGLLLACLWPAAAQAQTDEVVYFYTDAVGSVRMTMDGAGTVLARYDFHPFGGDAVPPTPPTPDVMQFAGKPRDAETGLSYFGARYYAGQAGRFTTVDPVLDQQKALLDPQRWNRYAYALNNPLRIIDPDGRSPWDLLDIASFALSVRDVFRDPTSSSKWGMLALDTAGLLPVLPSAGTVRRGLDAAQQLRFEFARAIGVGDSGLVIGRARDLTRQGALAEGEYRLGWDSLIRAGDEASLEAEWLVNTQKLEEVAKLGRRIRDASRLDDIDGFFLNRERQLLESLGWKYKDGFWSPPLK